MSDKNLNKGFYTTEDGRKIPIHAVSMMELTEIERGITAEFIERGEPVDPPTYKVTLAGGDTQEYPLNATILEVADDPDETQRRKDAWALHADTTQRLRSEIGTVTLSVIMEDGIAVGVPPEAWIQKMRRRHVKLPDDPNELRNFYVLQEFLRSPLDIGGVQVAIMQLSTGGIIPEKDIEAAQDTFFRALQEAFQTTAGTMAGSGSDSTDTGEETTGSLDPWANPE